MLTSKKTNQNYISEIRGYQDLYNRLIELDEKLNYFDKNQYSDILLSLCKFFPELSILIGKKQHKTHEYTADVHTILVLKKFIDSFEYTLLDEDEKLISKLAILFHDVAKKEGQVDKTHWHNSSLTAEESFKNIGFSKELSHKIVNLIKNHHWFEELSNNIISDTQVSKIFSDRHDWLIAKAFANADLNSVNENFYSRFEKSFPETTKRIDKIAKTQNSIL